MVGDALDFQCCPDDIRAILHDAKAHPLVLQSVGGEGPAVVSDGQGDLAVVFLQLDLPVNALSGSSKPAHPHLAFSLPLSHTFFTPQGII